MEFEVTDGLGAITIGNFEIGTYLKINKPVSVVWDECSGSSAMYMCLLPYDKSEKEEALNKLRSSIYDDFTGNEDKLFEILKPLIKLLANGKYNLSFYDSTNENTFFRFLIPEQNPDYGIDRNLNIEIPKEYTVIENISAKIYEHKLFLQDNEITKKYYSTNILGYTTHGFYEGSGDFALLATRPLNEINMERVSFFEEEIKEGKRPFALIMCDEWSYFVLDGHHKLMAYKNLNLYPPIALISYLPKDPLEIECDFDYLERKLFPWQVEHIVKNRDR